MGYRNRDQNPVCIRAGAHLQFNPKCEWLFFFLGRVYWVYSCFVFHLWIMGQFPGDRGREAGDEWEH
jgi:hypothetical protein